MIQKNSHKFFLSDQVDIVVSIGQIGSNSSTPHIVFYSYLKSGGEHYRVSHKEVDKVIGSENQKRNIFEEIIVFLFF